MEWLQVIFLALLQGLTEFLPISSSAHLILPAQILGWQDQGLAFDVAVHIGTLAAVVIYFRQDLQKMIYAWILSFSRDAELKAASREDSRLAWLIVLATIPAGIGGIVFNDFIAENLRATWVIASATIFFGICIYLADRMPHSRALSSIGLKDAVLIGAAQALALIPGTSRSGITIAMGLALGLERTAAARFSFLLSIPIIAAAGLLMMIELLRQSAPVDWLAILLGTAVSFVSAYLCIGWFLKLLARTGLLPFVIYRLVLGLVLFIFFV